MSTPRFPLMSRISLFSHLSLLRIYISSDISSDISCSGPVAQRQKPRTELQEATPQFSGRRESDRRENPLTRPALARARGSPPRRVYVGGEARSSIRNATAAHAAQFGRAARCGRSSQQVLLLHTTIVNFVLSGLQDPNSAGCRPHLSCNRVTTEVVACESMVDNHPLARSNQEPSWSG